MTYTIGDKVEGTVTGIQPYGVFVQLDEDTQGLVHISELKHAYVKEIDNIVDIGDKVEVVILDIDEYSKRISLSMKALQETNYHPFPHWKKTPRYGKRTGVGFKSIDDKLEGWIDLALKEIAEKESQASEWLAEEMNEIMHQIAGTIMLQDPSGQLRFLAKKSDKLFISTHQDEGQTAMATFIDEIKNIVDLDFDCVELVELTNSNWHGESIPFYLFVYDGPVDMETINQFGSSSDYAWMNHRDLKETFSKLDIQGVPNFI